MNLVAAVLTYNREKIAVRSIQSILSSRELISLAIFDDASNSEHYERMQSALGRDERVEFYRNESNLGYSKNLSIAIKWLGEQNADLYLLAESDMVFCRNWHHIAASAFALLPRSQGLACMLHRDSLRKNKSFEFAIRAVSGFDIRHPNCARQNPFGREIYSNFPDSVGAIYEPNYNVYVRSISNSVGTLLLKRRALDNIIFEADALEQHSGCEDAWMSYHVLRAGDFHQNSLITCDPGLALTGMTNGLHGPMFLNNVRWAGSVLTRTVLFSALITVILLVVNVFQKLNRRCK